MESARGPQDAAAGSGTGSLAFWTAGTARSGQPKEKKPLLSPPRARLKDVRPQTQPPAPRGDEAEAAGGLERGWAAGRGAEGCGFPAQLRAHQLGTNSLTSSAGKSRRHIFPALFLCSPSGNASQREAVPRAMKSWSDSGATSEPSAETAGRGCSRGRPPEQAFLTKTWREPRCEHLSHTHTDRKQHEFIPLKVGSKPLRPRFALYLLQSATAQPARDVTNQGYVLLAPKKAQKKR